MPKTTVVLQCQVCLNLFCCFQEQPDCGVERADVSSYTPSTPRSHPERRFNPHRWTLPQRFLSI